VVRHRPLSAVKYKALVRAVWAQVTVAPEVSRTVVFRRGTVKGEKTKIPVGGQTEPTSMAGLKEK